MTYRDERDALRGRIQGLEQDLQDARISQQSAEEKRARIEQIEGRMREAEQDLQALRSELASLRGAPPQPKKSSLGAPLLLVGTVLLAITGSVVLLVAKDEPPPPPHEPVVSPAVATAPVPVVEPPRPETSPAPASARQVAARWEGKVTRANGLPLAPGASCVVNSTLEGNGDTGRVVDLAVTCGGRPVYDSKDKLEGMSMNGYGLGEEGGKALGTFRYAVRYSDTGARSGPRTQVSLDSTQGQGAVWSDVVPIFRVEFQLPPLSVPVRGERLLSPAPAPDASAKP
ncbi:hypothetical protein [Polyangium mundeleinium]|uniref:Uncharacterized protein n=1 Tax=Polyangium mundeleinium TaxID=2995306 RepID=A0ABT5F0X2_9BACT|nr:hypothetical protein [Polyangium mundeleinium]MDC0747172.1 hypothetical protein [Polyangium mundeleinium]